MASCHVQYKKRVAYYLNVCCGATLHLDQCEDEEKFKTQRSLLLLLKWHLPVVLLLLSLCCGCRKVLILWCCLLSLPLLSNDGSTSDTSDSPKNNGGPKRESKIDTFSHANFSISALSSPLPSALAPLLMPDPHCFPHSSFRSPFAGSQRLKCFPPLGRRLSSRME